MEGIEEDPAEEEYDLEITTRPLRSRTSSSERELSNYFNNNNKGIQKATESIHVAYLNKHSDYDSVYEWKINDVIMTLSLIHI